MDNEYIRFENVRKEFPGVVALSDISFSVRKGEVHALLGENGAGKSTLLKAVTGIMEPTRGRIVRRGKVAALLELASGFDGDLTVKENEIKAEKAKLIKKYGTVDVLAFSRDTPSG